MISTTAMARNCQCPHLDNSILQLFLSDLCRQKQGVHCSQCEISGPNLWICLNKSCLHIGCSENFNDHSTIHYRHNTSHCIHMNQSSQRIWCYKCEMEVFILNHGYSETSCATATANTTATAANKPTRRHITDTEDHSTTDVNRSIASRGEFAHAMVMTPTNDVDIADDDADSDKYTVCDGLVGLQNIANTCYMNAALQALSNTPALTGYFLECGDIVEANHEMASAASSQRKTGLAKSYHRLIRDMWLGKKLKPNESDPSTQHYGFVVPSGILYGIRNVHPMFRGFQQHDTQEFLRCFMDQLHEELKEPTLPPPPLLLPLRQSSNANISSIYSQSPTFTQSSAGDDDHSGCSTPSLSQSEAEYETCDSGVSEQSSLSDEVASGNGQKTKTNQIQSHVTTSTYSRSPSPTASQRTFKSTQSSIKSVRSSSVTSLNSVQTHTQSDQEQTEKGETIASKLPHRSIISDVFDGKLLSSVQCLTCDRVSTREETFQDLSLPIPGKDHLSVLHQSQGLTSPLPPPFPPELAFQGHDGWIAWFWHWVRSFFWGPAVSLHDCMSAFFSADELKGDNMYSCEKCNKLRNGMKFSRVLELPEMLCVHLKRFRHDLSYSSKISSPVNFPLVGLDMRPYLHKDCKSKVSTYNLTAVICHHGTVGSGHYTSFAKNDKSGKWFEYDDQGVHEVSPEIVQNCEAYVLFYRKYNPQMLLIRDQVSYMNSQNDQSGIRFYVSRQWLNRLRTFAEPGPIDNWTLLCQHGGLTPRKARMANRLVVPLPQSVWDYLYERFGGGPACNHLFECDICRHQAGAIERRQNYEIDEFSVLKDETTLSIYAISVTWFRQWQMFVGNVTDEIPGPINNSAIALQSDVPVSRGVKPGSDYAQINSSLWKFFYSIYGGGPEIILRGVPDELTRLSITPNSNRERDERVDLYVDGQANINICKETTTVPVQMQITLTANVPQTDLKNAIVDASASKPAIQSTDDKVNGQQSNTTTNKKVIKYVSFEDNDSNSSDGEGATLFEHSFFYMRRGKHHYSTNHTSTGEILSKKDRRHRSGIKVNGFFGPEGTYSANTSQDDDIIANRNQNIATSSDTSKKLEEITPLLHQATISSTLNDPDGATHVNPNTTGRSKNSYRKRVKTKLGRKSGTLHDQ